MDTWFVFFHLAFSFLFVNALMRMSKFSRVTLVCATLCLASYFTLNSPKGTYWQLWASAIVLVHLINWNKTISKKTRKTDILEEDIWNDYFNELSDESYNCFLEQSSWEKLACASKITFSSDSICYMCTEEGSWSFVAAGSSIQVVPDTYILVLDIPKIKVLNTELYQKVIALVYSQNQSNIAS